MQFLFHMQFRTRFLMSGSRRKPLSRHRNRARASMGGCQPRQSTGRLSHAGGSRKSVRSAGHSRMLVGPAPFRIRR